MMQIELFSRPLKLLKARALPEGTVRQWGRYKFKKVGKKWLPVSVAKDGVKKLLSRAEEDFNEAISSGLPGVAIIDMMEKVYKIKGFDDLKKYVKTHSREKSISMYRGLWDYVSKIGLPKPKVRYAFDRLVKTMIILRDLYAKPKTGLMVKVKEGGKTRYMYKKPSAPVASARKIKSAKENLAGWTDMSTLPTHKQIREMIKKGTAKLVWGKINPRKKWTPVENKIIVPFKEREKGITVTMKQSRKIEQRTRRIAMLEMKIPYAFARQFLENHIKKPRWKNRLIGEMERSAGYRKYFRIKKVA